MTQLILDGPRAYFSDPWNWADFVYIYGSLVNVVIQNIVGPDEVITEVLMCIIVVLLLVKTFFFLRIRTSFTPIVIMLTNVIYDLRIFLMFYMILIFMFSQLFNVIGVGLSETHDLFLESLLEEDCYNYTVDLNYTEWFTDNTIGNCTIVGNTSVDSNITIDESDEQTSTLRFLKRVGGGSTKLSDDDSLIPPEFKYLGMFIG